MNYETVNTLLFLAAFVIFACIQSLFINGIHELFKGGCINDMTKGHMCKGNLGYMLNPDWFERNKEKSWAKPLWACVKCMASIWSIVTFFPLVIFVFGFHWWELYAWIMDAVSLIYLNFYFYKKL